MTEGVVAVGSGRTAGAERNEAVCILPRVGCRGAIYGPLRDVSVVVIGERGRAQAIRDLGHSVGVRLARGGVGVSHNTIIM